jgi:hypothetical protein
MELIYDVYSTPVLWTRVGWTILIVAVLFFALPLLAYFSKGRGLESQNSPISTVALVGGIACFILGIALFGGFYSRHECLTVPAEKSSIVEGAVKDFSYRSRTGNSSFQVASTRFSVDRSVPFSCGFTSSPFGSHTITTGNIVRIEFWNGKILRLWRKKS